MQITTRGKERDLTCVKYFSTFFEKPDRNSSVRVT